MHSLSLCLFLKEIRFVVACNLKTPLTTPLIPTAYETSQYLRRSDSPELYWISLNGEWQNNLVAFLVIEGPDKVPEGTGGHTWSSAAWSCWDPDCCLKERGGWALRWDCPWGTSTGPSLLALPVVYAEMKELKGVMRHLEYCWGKKEWIWPNLSWMCHARR